MQTMRKEPQAVCQGFEIAPGVSIGPNNECFIIAEIGANHLGDYELAKRLIKTAKDVGADCVSFEKSDLRSRFSSESQLFKGTEPDSDTFFEDRVRLEFSTDDLWKLKEYADAVGILFTATGHDKPSIDFLNELNVPFFKIAPADCTNISFCQYVARLKKPMVVNTGMADLEQLSQCIHAILKINTSIVVMQCTCAYPTPPGEVNLNVIKTYLKVFPMILTGYSGLEVGIGLTCAAVSFGAKVIERQLTIDPEKKGREQEASLEPNEFKEMVVEVKRITLAMGDLFKEFQESERDCFDKLGKAVVAVRYLPAGTILTDDMIDVKCTDEKGWPPDEINKLIGLKLKNTLQEDQSVCESDVFM